MIVCHYTTCVCVCALFIDKLPNGFGPESPAESVLPQIATAPALPWPRYTRMNQAEQGGELLAISSFLKLHATSHAPRQIGLATTEAVSHSSSTVVLTLM